MGPTWYDSEPIASRHLGMEEDLSQSCRRDHYCAMCLEAFCSHCCYMEHIRYPCAVIPIVGVDAAGQLTFCRRYPALDGELIEDCIISCILQHNYAARLTRDAYCIRCRRTFSTGICYHHHRSCGRDSIIRRIEEHDGRHYIRCKGDEKWFAHVESILGDPVGEDYGDLMLLPLLRRKAGVCMQCGGPTPYPLWARCSPACAASHDQEVDRRRERRDARLAVRQLAKLHVNGSN
ncbi:unnamed protein product [Urochloa humidicola]